MTPSLPPGRPKAGPGGSTRGTLAAKKDYIRFQGNASISGVAVEFTMDHRELHMAERKPSISRAPARPELDHLLQQSKQRGVTEAELEEQRVSFAYGNAPKGSRITKASVRRATKTLRMYAP